MPTTQNKKTELVVGIEGNQFRSLNVPTDDRADDFGLYQRLDEFVAQNTRYENMRQVVKVQGGVEELNAELGANGEVVHRGMRVTSIKYPQR